MKKNKQAMLWITATAEDQEDVLRAEMDMATTVQQIIDAIKRLPRQQRKIATLVLLERLTARQAADRLHLAISTVHNQLGKVKEVLQKKVGRYFFLDP